MNYSTLSPESETCSRSPAISSTAFHAQPPDLRFASLIDMGFATIGPLARRSRLRSGSCTLARVFAPRFFLQPHLTVTPLRFAITSPLSGCEEDLHLQAVEHARRTKKGRPVDQRTGLFNLIPAVTYVPTQLPVQYHRPGEA